MTKQRPTCIALILLAILTFSASELFAISWDNDLNGALNEAKKSGKPIMIDFYTTWCHWCKELDINTYTDSKVNSLADSFVCVKVDADKDPGAASKYSVRGYPTVIFLNSNGSVNNRVVGYKGPEAFASDMELVLKKDKDPAGRNTIGDSAQVAVRKPAKAKSDDVTFDKEDFERQRRKKIEKLKNNNLELNGIIINKGKKPIAVINDVFVKEGDIIGEGRVSKIAKDTAEVVFKDKTVVLKLE